MEQESLEKIACVVHQALSAWSAANGQPAYPEWSIAEPWMRESTYGSIKDVLADPDGKPGRQHEHWMAQKLVAGWRYGPVKDAAAKTHPLLVPFEQLPNFEQRKDSLIIAIVRALAG